MSFYNQGGDNAYNAYGGGGGYDAYNQGGAGGGFMTMNNNGGGFNSPAGGANNFYNQNNNVGGGGGNQFGTNYGDQGAGSASGSMGEKVKNITPMTVKQIQNFCTFSGDQQILCDGKPVSEVTLLVRIIEVQEQSSSIEFTVEDGTGKMNVKYWSNGQDDATTQKETDDMASWQAGAYVRMAGQLKVYQEKVQFTAGNIRTVTDHNELTHHYLASIFGHLQRTKGPLKGRQGSSSLANASMNANGTAPLGNKTNAYGTYGQQNQYGGQKQSISLGNDMQQKMQPQGENNANVMGNATGGDPKQAILQLVGQLGQDDSGVHWEEVAKSLQAQQGLDREVTRRIFEELTTEGTIYATIDEQHFKSSELYY